MNLTNHIKRNIKNVPGKKTKRKVVVIYVDDYGSVRLRDKTAYQNLKKAGIPVSTSRFSQYDTLADREDLSKLFNVLTSVKDKNGCHACFTPFVPVANPDFEKIRSGNFQDYYREPFTTTLEKYGAAYEGVFDLWQEGLRANIFYPAYHGTEHINVKRFMEALQRGHRSTRLAFDNESVAVPSLPGETPVKNPTTTFFIEQPEENKPLKKDIEVGTALFKELFGFRSKQFTPGAGLYSPDLHPVLKENGIDYIHVNRYRAYPIGNDKFRKQFLYNGKKNAWGQKYIVRNCVFEPDGQAGAAVVDGCLRDIETAFHWGAPALLSSHRVNFVGHSDKRYRDTNLNHLKTLLKEIVKKWPEVEFMNDDEMAAEVLNG